MNLGLMRKTVLKKQQFFIQKEDMDQIKAAKSDVTYGELIAFLAENKLRLVEQSKTMFCVIPKYASE